jgi:hypothetical protein
LAGTPGEVTRLLNDLKNGREDTDSKLISIVYKELPRPARGYMRTESRARTLQPTALVHPSYLKLVDQRAMNWQNRAYFFAVSAQLMRRILARLESGAGRATRETSRHGNDES